MITYIQVRLYDTLAGTTYSILQNRRGLSFDGKYNNTAVINLAYPLWESIGLNLDTGRLVGVVFGYSDDTSREINRYLIETTSDDRVLDDMRYRTFTGRSTLMVMDDAVVYPENGVGTAPTGHTFVDANPGTIFRTLMQRAKARGTLSQVDETSFSGSTDSAGAPWAFQYSVTFGTGVSYLSILSDLMSRGLVDAVMDGWTLRLYNGTTLGTHIPLSSLEIRPAQNVTEMVTSTDSTESASSVLVEGDEGTSVEVQDPQAALDLGRRRERFLSQGGVQDALFLTQLGTFELDSVKEIPQEETVGITDLDNLRLFTDVKEGDWVWVRQDPMAAPVERRIYQISASIDDTSGEVTLALTLNSILAESIIRLQRQLEGYTNGGLAGSPTTNTGEDLGIPKAPTGLVVTSYAFQTSRGLEAGLNATWVKPVQNENGTAYDDHGYYNVQWKYVADAWGPLYPNEDESWQYSPLLPNKQVNVRVQAVDTNEHVGAWSDVYTLFTANDVTPPPKPSKPTVTARLGTVTVSWDGLLGGVEPPVDFAYVEVHGSTNALLVPTLHGITALASWERGPAFFVHTDLPYNETWYYWFLAVDSSGNVSVISERSDPIFVVPLVNADLIGKVIDGQLNILNDSIVEANIAAAAVTVQQIAPLSIQTTSIQLGAITHDTIGANAITAAKISANAIEADKIAANAVTAVKIAALAISADKIQALAISADKIAANAITAGKMTIASLSATLVANGNFYDVGLGDQQTAARWVNASAGTGIFVREPSVTAPGGFWGKVSANTGAGNYGATLSYIFPVVPGTVYSVSGRFAYNGAQAKLTFAVGWFATDPGDLSTTETSGIARTDLYTAYSPPLLASPFNGERLSTQVTAPAGAYFGRIIIYNSNPTALSHLIATDIAFQAVLVSAHIANGAITTNKVFAGAITANEIFAGSVTTAKLAALAVEADKIAANAITADKIIAGAISAVKLTADAIDGKTINGVNITGSSTVVGAILSTSNSTSATRTTISNSYNPYTNSTIGQVEFFTGNTSWNPGRVWGIYNSGMNYGETHVASPYHTGSPSSYTSRMTLGCSTGGFRYATFDADSYYLGSAGTAVDFRLYTTSRFQLVAHSSNNKMYFDTDASGNGSGAVQMQALTSTNANRQMSLKGSSLYLEFVSARNVYFGGSLNQGANPAMIDPTANVGLYWMQAGSGEIHVYDGSGSNGRVIKASAFTVFSDVSLKTEIESLPSKVSLQAVMALRPVEYAWKEFPTVRTSGFIAQEVEQVLPHAVTGEDGKKGIESYVVTSVLVGAVQEQQAQIEELKTAVRMLTENLSEEK